MSLITWRVLLRMAHGRPVVEAEAAGWFSGVPSSAVVAVGGVVVLLLGGTRFAAVAPYVDPALVIIVSLGLLVIPVNLLRRSIRDPQTARPDSELVAKVETVVENVRAAEGLPEPTLRVERLGAIPDVALAFVLPPGTGDIACEDRVRRAVRDGLGDLPYSVWITVEFGYDAELFERGLTAAGLHDGYHDGRGLTGEPLPADVGRRESAEADLQQPQPVPLQAYRRA